MYCFETSPMVYLVMIERDQNFTDHQPQFTEFRKERE